MGRLYVVAILAVGCARVTEGPKPSADADNTPRPFGFHLVVHVFGGDGISISADGQSSTHAFIDHVFSSVDELPEFVTLPVSVNGIPLSLSTAGCAQPGPAAAYEHVVVSSLQQLDSSDLLGTVAYDCTYFDGATKALLPVSRGFTNTVTGTQL